MSTLPKMPIETPYYDLYMFIIMSLHGLSKTARGYFSSIVAHLLPSDYFRLAALCILYFPKRINERDYFSISGVKSK